MTELKPCPFCGVLIKDSIFQCGHKADCFIGKVIDREGFKTREKWDAAWNTRAETKALQEEVVRLYKEVGKAKSDLLINAADNNDTISTLTQRLAEVEKLLEVSVCPASCIDGAYHGHDGEPVQCQFCYERKQALSNSEGKPKCPKHETGGGPCYCDKQRGSDDS